MCTSGADLGVGSKYVFQSMLKGQLGFFSIKKLSTSI